MLVVELVLCVCVWGGGVFRIAHLLGVVVVVVVVGFEFGVGEGWVGRWGWWSRVFVVSTWGRSSVGGGGGGGGGVGV